MDKASVCVSVNTQTGQREKTMGEHDVRKMLASQRWVDDTQGCPAGTEIYLSQVTPTGKKKHN